MLINFEYFITMLFVVWTVGEVLIQALKNKLKIDNMLYSIIVLLVLAIFSILYYIFVGGANFDTTYIMNGIVYVVLCVIIPLVGYDTIVELLKRISK